MKIPRHVRKGEIYVGTREELLKYFRAFILPSETRRTLTSKSIEELKEEKCYELELPLEKQLNDIYEKYSNDKGAFGLIFFLRYTQLHCSLESFYVHIRPDDYYDKLDAEFFVPISDVQYDPETFLPINENRASVP